MRPAIDPLAHYIPVTESGCWLWLGRLSHNGYGRYKNRNASRVFYEAHVGEIPDGMQACHKCDTRSCVNPAHLFLGTAKENIRDCMNKGRRAVGKNHGMAKLTEDKVAEIRCLIGRFTQARIAEMYGVHQTTISLIKLGKVVWKTTGEGK